MTTKQVLKAARAVAELHRGLCRDYPCHPTVVAEIPEHTLMVAIDAYDAERAERKAKRRLAKSMRGEPVTTNSGQAPVEPYSPTAIHLAPSANARYRERGEWEVQIWTASDAAGEILEGTLPALLEELTVRYVAPKANVGELNRIMGERPTEGDVEAAYHAGQRGSEGDCYR